MSAGIRMRRDSRGAGGFGDFGDFGGFGGSCGIAEIKGMGRRTGTLRAGRGAVGCCDAAAAGGADSAVAAADA